MEKGIYYIGDPGYIIDDDVLWDKILRDNNYFEHGSYCDILDKKCFIGPTSYGDGIYLDNFSRKYGVDSGLISIIPESLLKKLIDGSLIDIDGMNEVMHMVEMKNDFECDWNNGIFIFGNIIIDTKNAECNNEFFEKIWSLI